MSTIRLWAVVAVAGLGLAGGAEAQVRQSTPPIAPVITISGGPTNNAVLPLGSLNTFLLTASGGTAPYALTASAALPPGFTLLTGNARTVQNGSLADTLNINPSVEGNYTFTIQAMDKNGLTGSQTYSIVVPGFTAPLTSVLPNASAGTGYLQKLYAFDNDPGVKVAWSSSGTLPCGLVISMDGTLSGTPSAPASCNFNLTVTAQHGNDDHSQVAHHGATFAFSLTVSSLAITNPPILPAAVAGVPYNYQMNATGGSGLTWSAAVCLSGVVCQNGLPVGLTISSTGLISGTPAYSSATFAPRVTVTDGSSPLSLTFTLPVKLPNPAPLSYEPAPVLRDAVVNQPYETSLKPIGGVGPYSWSLAPGSHLPSGLMLLSGNALPSDQPAGATVIAGEPSTAGLYTFSLTATDSANGQITRAFSLNVTPINLAPGQLQTAILGSLYQQQLTPTGGTAPYTYLLQFAAPLTETMPAGLGLIANGDTAGLITGTSASTGLYSAKLMVTDSASNTLTRTITLGSTGSMGTSINNGDVNLQLGAGVNIPLSVSTTGASGQYTWYVASSPASLPPGLSLDGPAITGTTTTAGTYTFFILATNTANPADTAVRQLKYIVSGLQVVAPALNRAIPGALPPAAVGSAYSFQLKAANGVSPYNFAASQFSPLPAGLVLEPSGLLHGTPTMSGVFPINVTATDATRGLLNAPTMVLTIAPRGSVAPLDTKQRWRLNDASVGSVYGTLLDPILSGGTAPYTWHLASGSTLPPGITLAAGSNGVSSSLVGVPTSAGTYSFSLNVADSGSQTLTVPVNLHVSTLTVSFSTVSGSSDLPGAQSAGEGSRQRLQPRLASPSGFVGVYYSRSVTLSGGTPPYTVPQQVGFVPGLQFNPTISGTSGTISGAPSAAGIFPLTLQLVDANLQTLNFTFEFMIDDAAGEVPTLSLSPQPVIVQYTPGSSAAVAVPVQVNSSTGSLSFAAAVEGISFATLTGANGSTQGVTNLHFDTTAPATAYGLVAVNSPGTVNQQDMTPVMFTVAGPQPQTITFAPFNPSSISYGTAAPALAATASSALAVSYSVSLSSAEICSVSGTTLAIKGVGSCSVMASQAGNGNYAAAASVTQTLTVVRASQAITFASFNPASISYGTAAPALTATASSGLPVSYSITVSPSAACSVSGSVLTINGVGLCSVVASQSGNTNYAAADSVSRSFSVTPISQTITFGPLSNVALGGAAPALSATASSGLPVSYSAGPGTVCSFSGSSLTLIGAGTCTVTASQGGTATVSAATAVTQNFAVLTTLAVTTRSLPAGARHAPYNQALSATGGSGGYQWSITAGSLPNGLSLGSSGAVSGTPNATGSSSFTVGVTDTAGARASQSLSIQINAGITIEALSLPDVAHGVPYSGGFTAVGGSGGYVWSLTGGSLPSGISLGSNGTLSGTSTATGTSTFTVTVTDSSGATASQGFTLKVDAGVSITTTSLPAGIQGRTYSTSLAATGGSEVFKWTVSAGSLPAGLGLSSNGVLGGLPTAPGSANFAVLATDQRGATATQGFSLQVNGTLTVTSSTLPAAVQGTAYSQPVAASGGSGALTWSIAAGSLPSGLTLGSSGAISGTPGSPGSSAFTVGVTDQAGSHALGALSIVVNPQLTIQTTSLKNAVSGAAYSQTLAASGGSGSYSWSITAGAPPTGISLSPGGTLSGTSTASGPFSFTVQVTDQAGNTKTQGLSLQVSAPLAITNITLPNGVTGKPYSASFAATGGTGGPYVWSVVSGSLPAGVTLSPSGAISGNPSVAGPYSFTVQVADGASTPAQASESTTVYNVLSINTAFLPNGTVGQSYGPAALAATGGSGTVTWSIDGLPTGLTGSTSGSISGTPTAAGNVTVSITATDAISTQTVQVPLGLTIVAAVSPLTISPSSLVLGSGAGGNVSGGFTAAGGTPPLTWSISAGSLPSGVTLNPANGGVSGSASQAGNTSATVSVTDGKTTATAQLTINILGFTTTAIPAGAATVAYSAGVATAGGTPPYVFSASGLPTGVSMGGAGTLAGTVATPGSYPFSVQVNDGQGLSVSSGFTLTVRNAPVSVKAPSLPNATVGIPYSQVLTATGGNPPYAWSTTGGALPTGLSLSSSGTISGNPSIPGPSVFAVQATDASGGVASAAASILVQPSNLTITTTSLPSGALGFDYPAQVLGATGGTAPYTFSITGGGFPDGMSLAGGVISGNPAASGSFPLTLSVKDAGGATATASVTLTIRPSTSDLQLSSGNVSFSLASGATTLPGSQTVSVQATVASQPVTYTLDVEPPSPWLDVETGSKTPNTLAIGLTSQALNFSPGSYSATVTLTCTSASCNNNTQSVAVGLTVSAPPPQLSVSTTLLSFSSNSTPPQPQSQPLTVSNTGGGTITVNSVTCEAPWCSVGSVPGTLAGGSAATVTLAVNPAQLGNGFFRTAVDVSTSAGKASVPVNFFVTQTVSMTLSPSGSQFQMQQGGTPGNVSGSFLVGVSGGSSNWSATVLPGASWLSLGSASGTSTSTQPGTVTFSINSAAASLPAQAAYGTIEVTAPGLVNSPQDYQVVLNVQAQTSAVQADPQPGGLLFLTTVGAASPAAQIVTVYSSSATPVSYQASANATGGTWLSVAPTLSTTSSSAPDTSTVTVNTTGLGAGTYTGGISYASTSAAVRTVSVTLVVAPAGGAAVAASDRRAMSAISPQGTCAPTGLVAAPTTLVANFSAPTSWPTPLAIVLVNDCGQFVTDGQVTATFSNGDPPLALPLVNSSKGLYSATWTPRNAAGQVTVMTRATSASGLAPATAQISGAVIPNAVPVINPQATVHAFNPQIGGALAPGTIIAVYGANLASRVAQPDSIPLVTTLNGTSVIIGGIPSPLFYVSPGQINVQVPFELDPSKQYQVVVSANGAIATPQTIQMTSAIPGLAAFGDGTLIAQHQDGSLITETSPAQPGEYLVMYLLGMGLTSNQVQSGDASPGPPGLATPDLPPTLTLGGQPVNLLFAGLTPSLVGLYQINMQVPPNSPGGNQVLVVSQNGVVSNTTILPVQVQ